MHATTAMAQCAHEFAYTDADELLPPVIDTLQKLAIAGVAAKAYEPVALIAQDNMGFLLIDCILSPNRNLEFLERAIFEKVVFLCEFYLARKEEKDNDSFSFRPDHFFSLTSPTSFVHRLDAVVTAIAEAKIEAKTAGRIVSAIEHCTRDTWINDFRDRYLDFGKLKRDGR